MYHRGMRFSLIQTYEFGEGIQLVEFEVQDSHSTKHESLEEESDLLKLRDEILNHPRIRTWREI